MYVRSLTMNKDRDGKAVNPASRKVIQQKKSQSNPTANGLRPQMSRAEMCSSQRMKSKKIKKILNATLQYQEYMEDAPAIGT